MTILGPWSPLPTREWYPTIRSLHRWSQVVGKVPLALATPSPHWWHVALTVTPFGLRTGTIPLGNGLLEVELDLREHRLWVRRSDRPARAMKLQPMSVADFYCQTLELLADQGVSLNMRPVPVEVEDATPFMLDRSPGGYDPDHAVDLHSALLNANRVLARFRTSFLGKASPVHFFWGSFDLAVTRFSGRTAPRHPGGVPNCPDWVMHEAYSHEVNSAGWWPGSGEIGPSFYAYMYPVPDGYPETALKGLTTGHYDARLGEFLLSYEEASRCDDPDSAVLNFLERTYRSGAQLASWDLDGLERPQRPQTRSNALLPVEIIDRHCRSGDPVD